jgi:uncharacterized membrane protein
MTEEPKLYNWVRAIKKISLISACYCAAILVLGLCFGFYLQTQADHGLERIDNYQLVLTVLATLLLTLGIRKICLRNLRAKFLSSFNYELLLASWCIVLVLIHLECQLLVLASATSISNPLLHLISFGIAVSVLITTWPRLKSIQSLLEN